MLNLFDHFSISSRSEIFHENCYFHYIEELNLTIKSSRLRHRSKRKIHPPRDCLYRRMERRAPRTRNLPKRRIPKLGSTLGLRPPPRTRQIQPRKLLLQRPRPARQIFLQTTSRRVGVLQFRGRGKTGVED